MNKLGILLFVILVSSGCGFNEAGDRMNLTIACGDGDLAGVKEYLALVGTADYISVKGAAPLHAAAYNGHLEVVRLLLAEGASCGLQDSSGRTALEVAADQQQVAVVTYLATIEGCTAAQDAAIEGN